MSTSKPTTFSPIKYDELCFLAGEPIPNGWVYCELPPGMTAPPIHLTRTDDGIVREYYRERLARVGDIGRADSGEGLPFSEPKTANYEYNQPSRSTDEATGTPGAELVRRLKGSVVAWFIAGEPHGNAGRGNPAAKVGFYNEQDVGRVEWGRLAGLVVLWLSVVLTAELLVFVGRWIVK